MLSRLTSKVMEIFLIKLIVLIGAIVLGVLATTKIIEPKILYPNCFTETNSCVGLSFRRKDNTALIQVYPQNYYLWYNGKYLFVYGEPTSRSCADTTTDPVYMADLKSGSVMGYGCIAPITEIQKLYEDQAEEYMFYRVADLTQAPDAFQVMKIFFDQGILV
jgi:hypothetical protein